MRKEIDKASGERSGNEDSPRLVLIQISTDDFLHNEDGSWIAVRDIYVDGDTSNPRLMKEGRAFKKGDLSVLGLDLAALLEKHCSS